MQIWGITGVIGSGKSTAIRYLASKGYPTVDADEIARIVVDRNRPEGKEGFERIFRTFGPKVLDNLGNLDRKALRKIIMLSPGERDKLETILHPLILSHIRTLMGQWKQEGVKMGFVEGARLVESGFHKVLGGLILVTSPQNDRVKRIMKRDSMAKDEVIMMFGLQDENFMKMACKTTWTNDKKEADFYKIIDAFIAEKLKAPTS